MAAKHTTKSAKAAQKAIRVKANDMVKIVYNDGATHHKAGDEALVHRVQADKLVEKGVAEYANAKDKPKATEEDTNEEK